VWGRGRVRKSRTCSPRKAGDGRDMPFFQQRAKVWKERLRKKCGGRRRFREKGKGGKGGTLQESANKGLGKLLKEERPNQISEPGSCKDGIPTWGVKVAGKKK